MFMVWLGGRAPLSSTARAKRTWAQRDLGSFRCHCEVSAITSQITCFRCFVFRTHRPVQGPEKVWPHGPSLGGRTSPHPPYVEDSPRDPSTFSEETWTLQTYNSRTHHLLTKYDWIPRVLGVCHLVRQDIFQFGSNFSKTTRPPPQGWVAGLSFAQGPQD